MKLHDLFERQKFIEGPVEVPVNTTKLDYAGFVIKSNFVCSSSQITSLEGSPVFVGGYFSCSFTEITSLEGAPRYVGEDFTCYRTKIKSLLNVHKQIKHIGGSFQLPNTIKSNVLGVMYIKGLKSIQFDQRTKKQKQVEIIINKHLSGDRDVHACQEELLEAGLGEYAKL